MQVLFVGTHDRTYVEIRFGRRKYTWGDRYVYGGDHKHRHVMGTGNGGHTVLKVACAGLVEMVGMAAGDKQAHVVNGTGLGYPFECLKWVQVVGIHTCGMYGYMCCTWLVIFGISRGHRYNYKN